MKLSIISDIHGNHYALKEVLYRARRQNIKKLLVLGDICGYYYHPEKVLEMIEEWDHELIRGNHEKILLQLKKGIIEEEVIRKKYGSGHRFALDKLTPQALDKITLAPDSKKINIEGVSFLMCHGSPFKHEQYLYPDTSEEILKNCDVQDVDFVLIGHSHYQFIYRNINSTLINVGSVGQSRDTGGIASWAVIHTETKSIELKYTPYSTYQLEKEIDSIDPDVSYLKEILKRNRFNE